MDSSEDPRVLARGSIVAPPGMQTDNRRRVGVYLAPTHNGSFRWFRDDGTPTVVAGSSIENASRAASFAWRAWDLQIEEAQQSR